MSGDAIPVQHEMPPLRDSRIEGELIVELAHLHDTSDDEPTLGEFELTREVLRRTLAIEVRLVELMRRCREERHEITYADLVAVKGTP